MFTFCGLTGLAVHLLKPPGASLWHLQGRVVLMHPCSSYRMGGWTTPVHRGGMKNEEQRIYYCAFIYIDK